MQISFISQNNFIFKELDFSIILGLKGLKQADDNCKYSEQVIADIVV